jgi:hypothetical protein
MSQTSKAFTLQAGQIYETIVTLKKRLDDRFPNSGLGRVCENLMETARHASEKASWLRRPLYHFRFLAWVVTVTLLLGSAWSLWSFGRKVEQVGLAEFIQVSEAGINDIVLIAAAIFFLHTLEKRIKRSRALKSIHELRSVAHIIDMHQLTKDPERVTSKSFQHTPSSPQSAMTPFQLRRYLDYCSEMLSLTSKIAALYAQDLDDATVLASVSEVENLTTGLSRKIWQKITLLHSFEEQKKPLPAPTK